MSVQRIKPEQLPATLAAARAGDRLCLEVGEVKGTITIDKAITIEGQGPGTLICGNGPVLRVTARDVVLKNFQVEANAADEVAILYGSEPPTLDRVKIRRGRLAATSISFAPPPVIKLKDEQHRHTTQPVVLPGRNRPGPVAVPISAPPPTPQPQPQPRTKPPTQPPQARTKSPTQSPPRAKPQTQPPPSRTPTPTPKPSPPPPSPKPIFQTPAPPPVTSWGVAKPATDWRIVAGIVGGVALIGTVIWASKMGSQPAGPPDAGPKQSDKGSTGPSVASCDDGDPAACLREGHWQRACELHNPQGCIEWGQSLESAAPKDAVSAYARGCSQNSREACDRENALRARLTVCNDDTADRIFDKTSPKELPKPKPIDRAYWRDALATGLEVARLRPNCPEVIGALAHIYYRDTYSVCADAVNAEGLARIISAENDSPGSSYIFRNKGRVLAGRGEFEEALVALRKSEALRSEEQTREWIHSITATRQPREEMLEAADVVLSGAELSQEIIDALGADERLVVSKAVGARHGLSSELPAIDRLYFCPTSAPGFHLEVNENIRGSDIDTSDEDDKNLKQLGHEL